MQIMHRRQYLAPTARIEHRRRFVENDCLRLHCQHARNRNPLLLSAREQMRRMRAVFLHAHGRERRIDPPSQLRTRYAEVFRAESYIFFHHGRHDLVIRVLEYHAHPAADIPQAALVIDRDSVHQNIALRRGEQYIQMLGESRFAAAVRTDNRDKLPARDRRRDVFKGKRLLPFFVHIRMADMIDHKHRFRFYHRFRILSVGYLYLLYHSPSQCLHRAKKNIDK